MNGATKAKPTSDDMTQNSEVDQQYASLPLKPCPHSAAFTDLKACSGIKPWAIRLELGLAAFEFASRQLWTWDLASLRLPEKDDTALALRPGCPSVMIPMIRLTSRSPLITHGTRVVKMDRLTCYACVLLYVSLAHA